MGGTSDGGLSPCGNNPRIPLSWCCIWVKGGEVGEESMEDVGFQIRNRVLSSVPSLIEGIPVDSGGAVNDEMTNGVTTMCSLCTKAGWTSLVGSFDEGGFTFEFSNKVERRKIGHRPMSMRKLASFLRVRRRRRQHQSVSTKTTKPTTLPPIAPATIRVVDVCAGGDEDDALVVDVTRGNEMLVGVESPDHGIAPAAFEDVTWPEEVGVELAGRGFVVVGSVIGLEEGVVGGELRQPFEARTR